MLKSLKYHAPLLAKSLAATSLLVMLEPTAWASSNMINERLPVQHQEMEQHWQVDCMQTWQTLLLRAQQAAQADTCSIPPQLLKALKMCAYIYQPPGTESGPHCPDYSGASKHLENGSGEEEGLADSASRQQCQALRTLPAVAPDCH